MQFIHLNMRVDHYDVQHNMRHFHENMQQGHVDIRLVSAIPTAFHSVFKMIYNYMRDYRINKYEMSSCKKLHVHITNSQSHVYYIRSAQLCIDLLT